MPTTGVDINHNNLHISNHTPAGNNSKAMDISNHSSSSNNSNTINNSTVVNSTVVKDSKTKSRRWSRSSCPGSSTSYFACSVIDFEDVSVEKSIIFAASFSSRLDKQVIWMVEAILVLMTACHTQFCHILEQSAEISSAALRQPTQYSTTRHPTRYMHP